MRTNNIKKLFLLLFHSFIYFGKTFIIKTSIRRISCQVQVPWPRSCRFSSLRVPREVEKEHDCPEGFHRRSAARRCLCRLKEPHAFFHTPALLLQRLMLFSSHRKLRQESYLLVLHAACVSSCIPFYRPILHKRAFRWSWPLFLVLSYLPPKLCFADVILSSEACCGDGSFRTTKTSSLRNGLRQDKSYCR